MEQLLISPYWLALLFFVVSLAYSSAGLGGGTSYTALLGALGAGRRAIPTVGLMMNTVVSLIVAFNYVGSFSGSYMGALRLRRRTIRRVMGLIIVAAVVLLGLRVWG